MAGWPAKMANIRIGEESGFMYGACMVVDPQRPFEDVALVGETPHRA